MRRRAKRSFHNLLDENAENVRYGLENIPTSSDQEKKKNFNFLIANCFVKLDGEEKPATHYVYSETQFVYVLFMSQKSFEKSENQRTFRDERSENWKRKLLLRLRKTYN